MGNDHLEQRVVARAVERGLVSASDVERARAVAGTGGSVVEALVRLGALTAAARAALVGEVAPLDPFASVAVAPARPSGRFPVGGGGGPGSSSFSPQGSFDGAGPPPGTGGFAAVPPGTGAFAAAGPRPSRAPTGAFAAAGPRPTGAAPAVGGAGAGVGAPGVGAPGAGGRRPSERTGRGPEALGPWTLVKELGRGSNGIVYRARREGEAVEVALKVMPDLLRAGGEAVARFRQEVALGRRLDHPAVVRVLDAGEAGPHAWFAMELCAGETLADRLRRGPMRPVEAARVVAVVARAIGHAHARHVVHRDLKPANIMLEAGGPRVTDFGLARDEARGRSLTRTGDVLGTPLYMAPEQLTGQRGIDGRIDVWALGVILFECVSGRRPFGAPDPVTLARQITAQDAPLLRSYRPDAPAELEAIVRRALVRDPAERLQTADELAEELEAFLRASGDEPPPGREAERRERRAGGARRRRAALAVAAAGGALALVVLGGWFAVRSQRRAEAEAALQALAAAPVDAEDAALRVAARAAVEGAPERAVELAALEARRDEARRAAATVRALRAALEAPDLDALAGAATAVRAAGVADAASEVEFAEALVGLEAPARACDADGAREALARARALVSGGARERAFAAARARAAEVALATAGGDASALRVEQALARVDAAALLAGDDPALRDRARVLRARTLVRRARLEQARDEARAIVDARGDAPLDATAAEALLLLARSTHELQADAAPLLARLASGASEPWQRVAEGEQALLARDPERAAARARAALERDPGFAPALDLLARLEMTRARVAREPVRYAAAEEAVRRAREAAPDDAWLDLWRALLRFDQRDYEGKVAALTHAIELTEPEPMFRALFWRAHTRVVLGRHQEALRDLERCLRQRPDDAEALLWRPVCWTGLGQVDRARAEWRRLARSAPDLVDAHLRGRTATVELEPVWKGLLDALIAEARRQATPAPSMRPGVGEALGELVRRAATLAPWDELAPLLAAAEVAAGDDASARDMVALEGARAMFRRGRMADARAMAQTIVDRGASPRAALEARFLQAITWLWGGDVRRGVELLGQLHVEDEGPTGCSAGATWNSYQGRNGLGELLARAAATADPNAVEPLIGLAFCLNDLGRFDEGLQLVDEALRRVPDHVRGHMARHMLLSNLRRTDEAEAALDVVVRLTEPAPVARALRSRAQERLNRGRHAAALEDLDRVLAGAPDDVEALCLRAAARLLSDQRDLAATDLRRARALDARAADAWLARLSGPLRQRLVELAR